MFLNFIRLTFRRLWSHKTTSFIHLLGLSAGLVVAILIALWVYDEYAYERFHEKYDRLYQVILNDHNENGEVNSFAAAPLPLVEVLRKSIPEIKYAVEQDWGWEHGLMVGEKRLFKKGLQVHGDFLKMFTFPLIKGDVNTALSGIHSIVLTEQLASTLFGQEDPMGKIVRIDNREDLLVTGIMKNPPSNTEFEFEYIVPFNYFEFSAPWVRDARSQWETFAFQQYVELEPGAVLEQVLSKIKNLIKDNTVQGQTIEVSLHPMSQWRLYSEFKNGVASGGFIRYVRLFSMIGIFVLIIACINFMNLSTARSEKRAREVGVRKVIGSSRSKLIWSFLGESLLVVILSFFLSLLLVEIFLPYFNRLTSKELFVPYSKPAFWISSSIFLVITGLLAGSYPAFFLSSFKPMRVLKGNMNPRGLHGVLPRKILVVTQFGLCIGLLIGTLVIFKQINHARCRPTGYDPDRLITVNGSPDISRYYNSLKNDLLASGQVSSVTKSSSPMTAVFNHFPDVEWPGKKVSDKIVFSNITVGDHYFRTTGTHIIEGRAFHDQSTADSLSVIFNETAIRQMGLENPLGQVVRIFGAPRMIVGISRDVVMESPFHPVEPTMYQYHNDWAQMVIFRLSPTVNAQDALTSLEKIFRKHNPAYPFDYQFVDAEYAKKFGNEKLTGQLAGIFGGLAIFISCLGLLGLAAFVTEQRTKEIGIRKVLGASTWGLVNLLSGQFLKLVGFAFLVVTPLSYYLMERWLSTYQYRISVPWTVFVIAGLFVLTIAFITVCFQSLKAALANPVKSLRNE